MALDLDDPNVRAATFGRQVELFLESDIGAYLVERAKEQTAAAVEDLKRVDPTDTTQIMAAQMKARIADSIMAWLGDAIAQGESSREMLEQEHN